MKNRLNKSLSRLKKEKLVEEDKDLISKKITPFEFKIFKTLSDKYDLSLSNSNEQTSQKESAELSDDQKKTLNRIKRGEKFEI
jgi:hypothetical protein